MNSNDQARVPVTVLTGFLGSGKTTLLNRILTEQHGLRIAVIENEFGEIGIDNQLVINAEEEIFEMNNGCICCTVRGDLIRILGNLMRRRDKFDLIIVETTGLADPAPVAQTFFVDAEIQEKLRLDGVVTLVDAKHIWLHLDESSECQEQIAFADSIILNKCDLVEDADLLRLEQRIRSINALAAIHRTVNANVDIRKVLELGGFDLDRALEHRPAFLEPEYPFEWAGMVTFPAGVVDLHLSDGPDPEMTVLIMPGAEPSQDALATMLDRAAAQFRASMDNRQPGETLAIGDASHLLALSQPGTKTFHLNLTEPTTVAMFTQHHPDEFQMVVEAAGRPLEFFTERAFNAGHEHDDSVTSVGIVMGGELDQKRLNAWMGELLSRKGPDIFRMKGILAVKGLNRKFVFQGVHMLFDGEPKNLWADDELRSNQIVFIGRNLDREELTAGFRDCLA